MTYTLTIRPKRQITLPSDVANSLGLEVGDQITLNLKDRQAILTPNKSLALDALQSIQKAFRDSGVPEADLQALAKDQRYAPKPRLY